MEEFREDDGLIRQASHRKPEGLSTCDVKPQLSPWEAALLSEGQRESDSLIVIISQGQSRPASLDRKIDSQTETST